MSSPFPDHVEKPHLQNTPIIPTHYVGSGTADDPYVVEWDLNDPEDPYNWKRSFKWLITAQLALSTFTVSFSSSVYSGGLQDTMRDLGISYNVAILGISLYVLGFALGPLVFASMGEMLGRRIVFLVTWSLYTAFQLQGALAHTLPTLLSCRLLTGIFGSSPLTNAGGAVSDIWSFRERGLASAIYATVPFLGPVIGPIVGGFVVQNPNLGWHFNFWLMFIFSAITLLVGYFLTPETYAPVLLRHRARKYMEASNGIIHYVSVHDRNKPKSLGQVMRTNLKRPFAFLATEPIVMLLAIYISIVYGTLYALFSGFPIVFQQHRGFSPGQGGLAFLGVGLGITLGTASQSIQNRLYWRSMDKSETGRASPEARLHMAILGAVLTPIGLWWFAWTTQPRIHWIVPIIAGIPFGTGISQILQSLTTYLMDTYGIYFASAIAATVVLRSLCGAVFPLFAPSMFKALGDQWAMSVFACLSTACMPIPFLFFKYGTWIRSKSRFAYKESDSNSNSESATLSTVTVTTCTAPCSESNKHVESAIGHPHMHSDPLSSSSASPSSSYTASNLHFPPSNAGDSMRCTGLESRTVTMSSQLDAGDKMIQMRGEGVPYLVYNPTAAVVGTEIEMGQGDDTERDPTPGFERTSRLLEKETVGEIRDGGEREVEVEVLKRVDTKRFGRAASRRSADDSLGGASQSVTGRPGDEQV